MRRLALKETTEMNGLPEFIVKGDLRALLFWANVGVRQSTSGSYRKVLEIIPLYAKRVNLRLPRTEFKETK